MVKSSKKMGCGICKHSHRNGTCAAFPNGIPFIFLAWTYPHTEPIEGQTGDFVYEWGSPEELKAKSLAAIAARDTDEREAAVSASALELTSKKLPK